ncbi:MAG TPA: cob(I)yrinic acid a,c-diamide adenosyltransferase [Fibrobacteria bacterium]|nr:cob(I)yrinic acid a,c-diamide adenosyltransferase [Fibrobacteria bacterium]
MTIHITRVYTRGGDGGQTSLVGGARVDKDCRKLESYGTVDELICLVGAARTAITASGKGGFTAAIRAELETGLRRVQNRLFDAGSILATPAGQSYPGMPEIADDDATGLEREMDAMQKSLEPLTSFVLPGGTMPNALLHQCRAVCRRAEREILRLSREEPVDKRLIKYVNRLSDYFFVMSRYASRKAGVPEYLWEYGPGTKQGKAPGKREEEKRPPAPEKRVSAKKR